MATIGVRELKTHMTSILREVEELGETVDITRRGKVIARLMPATPVQPERPWSEADRAAFWAEWDALVDDIAAKTPSNVSVEDVMRDMRREL